MSAVVTFQDQKQHFICKNVRFVIVFLT